MIAHNIENILFFDIETVPIVPHFQELNTHLRDCWEKKAKQTEGVIEANEIQVEFEKKAALYAEFARPVCIVVGFFNAEVFNVKRIYGDEVEMLNALQSTLSHKFTLCGHNIKEFDIPFLCRRYVINNLEVPSKINFVNKKPWEVDVIDTMDIWKFGTFKNFVSLDLLTAALGIPSPKEKMHGSNVAEEFYKGNIVGIADYCTDDVVATAKVVRRFKRMDLEFNVINK